METFGNSGGTVTWHKNGCNNFTLTQSGNTKGTVTVSANAITAASASCSTYIYPTINGIECEGIKVKIEQNYFDPSTPKKKECNCKNGFKLKSVELAKECSCSGNSFHINKIYISDECTCGNGFEIKNIYVADSCSCESRGLSIENIYVTDRCNCNTCLSIENIIVTPKLKRSEMEEVANPFEDIDDIIDNREEYIDYDEKRTRS